MAESALAKSSRCGHCYEEFSLLSDPKELPCHHVFCLPCLQADIKDGNIQCITCQSVHTTELSELSPAKVKETAGNITTMHCGCYNCESQQAILYCVQCAKGLCDSHEQTHLAMFGAEHQLISAADYLMAPGKYKRVLCRHHGDALVMACKKCDQFICCNCDRFQTKCTGENSQHDFSSFNTAREEITSQFDELLSKANKKLTEICRLDKKIWKSLDEEEVRCEEMVEMIERVRDKQLELVRQESENLKKLVYEYRTKVTNQVEAYNSKLMAQKEELEDTRTKVQGWLREGHVTEQTELKQEMADELVKKTDEELNCQLSGKLVLFPKEERTGMNMLTTTTPSSLTFSNKHYFDSSCFSVCHRADGSLLVGLRDGLTIVGGDNSINNPIKFSGSIAATEHKGTVHVIRMINDKQCTVERCSPDLTQRHLLFKFTRKGNVMVFLAVSDMYVVATNSGCDQLVVYDVISKQTINVSLDVKPSAVCFVSNTDILVTSLPGKQLVRYHIENGELEVVWTCDDVNGLGVCVDGGLVLVSSSRQKLLYIISLQGEKLEELKLESLPAVSGQISVKEDELAVPGWGDKHVHLFKIHR